MYSILCCRTERRCSSKALKKICRVYLAGLVSVREMKQRQSGRYRVRGQLDIVDQLICKVRATLNTVLKIGVHCRTETLCQWKGVVVQC